MKNSQQILTNKPWLINKINIKNLFIFEFIFIALKESKTFNAILLAK